MWKLKLPGRQSLKSVGPSTLFPFTTRLKLRGKLRFLSLPIEPWLPLLLELRLARLLRLPLLDWESDTGLPGLPTSLPNALRHAEVWRPPPAWGDPTFWPPPPNWAHTMLGDWPTLWCRLSLRLRPTFRCWVTVWDRAALWCLVDRCGLGDLILRCLELLGLGYLKLRGPVLWFGPRRWGCQFAPLCEPVVLGAILEGFATLGAVVLVDPLWTKPLTQLILGLALLNHLRIC